MTQYTYSDLQLLAEDIVDDNPDFQKLQQELEARDDLNTLKQHRSEAIKVATIGMAINIVLEALPNGSTLTSSDIFDRCRFRFQTTIPQSTFDYVIQRKIELNQKYANRIQLDVRRQAAH